MIDSIVKHFAKKLRTLPYAKEHTFICLSTCIIDDIGFIFEEMKKRKLKPGENDIKIEILCGMDEACKDFTFEERVKTYNEIENRTPCGNPLTDVDMQGDPKQYVLEDENIISTNCDKAALIDFIVEVMNNEDYRAFISYVNDIVTQMDPEKVLYGGIEDDEEDW